MKTINKRPLILLLLLISQISLSAQEILDYVEMKSSDFTLDYIFFDEIHNMENGDYYVIISEVMDEDISIGDLTIESPYFPDSLTLPPTPKQSILAKFNKDFELIDYVHFANLQSHSPIVATEDRIFLPYAHFYNHPHFMLNDSLLLTSGNEGGLLEFDFELNFVGRKQVSKNYIDNIVASDTILYYEALLTSTEPFIEIEGDTIWNYPGWVHPDTTIYVGRTSVIVRYDYRRDKIESYWRYGSPSDEYIVDMILDDEENIFILGYTGAWFNFTLDNIDSLPAGPDVFNDCYYAQFDKDGNLLRGRKTNDIQADFFQQILADDSGIYLRGWFVNDTLILANDTLVNALDETGERGERKGCIVKLDYDLNYLWAYTPIGYSNNSETHCMLLNSKGLYASFISFGPSLNIQGNNYSIPEGASFIMELDSETGEEKGHFFLTKEDSRITHMDFEEEGRMNVLINLRSEQNIYGTSFGNDFKSIHYLLKIDFDFLTSIKDIPSESSVKIYPNPVSRLDQLQIESPSIIFDQYSIFDIQGNLISQDFLNGSDYPLKQGDLPALKGIYYLILKNDERSSVHIISIVD